MNSDARAELENRLDDLERAAEAAFQRPLSALGKLPGLVADLIDVLRGVIEATGEDDG